MRELLRIDAVVFVFAAMNGFDIERMGQHESQARTLAGIGQPVPAEHTFAANRQVTFVRLNQFEKEVEVIVFDVAMDQFLSLSVHDADVHLARMQIDSAVVFGGGCIIFHTLYSLDLVTLGTGLIGVILRGVFDALPAHCSHAIKKPKGLKWEYQKRCSEREPAV